MFFSSRARWNGDKWTPETWEVRQIATMTLLLSLVRLQLMISRIEMRQTQHNTGCIQKRNAERKYFLLSVKWSLLAKHLRKGAEKSCSSEMRTSGCFSNELSPALSLDGESSLETTWHGGASAVINGDKSDQRSGNPINRLSISSYIRLIITPAYVCLTSLGEYAVGRWTNCWQGTESRNCLN